MDTSALDETVVVPLGDSGATDPWELLARGEGALLSKEPRPNDRSADWGPALRSAGALGRHLAQITVRGADVMGAKGARYRLQMPPGYGEGDLLRAVGGGLRAIATGSGGKIAAHATLVPVAGTALNPVALGLLAMTIATEMAGGDEQARTLAAIESGVDRLNTRFAMDDDARLRTAEQTIRAAHAALLDDAAIPESVGLGAAMTDLQVIRNRSEALLTGWERVVSALPPEATPGEALRTNLGRVGDLGWESFPAAVRTAYHSLALDSRRIVLTVAEAQLRNPGSSLTSFRAAVEKDLDARATELDRLRALLARLASTPLTTSAWDTGFLPHWVTEGADENGRAQALFATLYRTLTTRAPVDPSGSTITIDSRPNGDLQLVRPA